MSISSTQQRVLILFAHPALHKSRVNAVLIGRIRDLAGVTFHDLYEAYPEFDIDVSREQTLLLGHDIVVFQHPFYWSSAPAILKEWQDLVLEHGWAYGRYGNALCGKTLLSAITTGGDESAYEKGGGDGFTMRELLRPFEQTARVCGMTHLPPFVVHGTHALGREEIERHADDYRRAITGLRDGHIDLEKAGQYARLNSDLAAIIRS
jgi:glutathione-regulated potassium-efflux system ancillary protein KefG